MSAYQWAAGYIDDGNRPKIVTSRFHLEDSYALDRYHATGGYAGLKAALARPPAPGTPPPGAASPPGW